MNTIKPFKPAKGLVPTVRNISTLNDDMPQVSPIFREDELTFKQDSAMTGELLLTLLEALRQFRVQSGGSISVTNNTNVIRNNICSIVNNFRSASGGSGSVSLNLLLKDISEVFSAGMPSEKSTELLIDRLSGQINDLGITSKKHGASVSEIRSGGFSGADRITEIVLKKNAELTGANPFSESMQPGPSMELTVSYNSFFSPTSAVNSNSVNVANLSDNSSSTAYTFHEKNYHETNSFKTETSGDHSFVSNSFKSVHNRISETLLTFFLRSHAESPIISRSEIQHNAAMTLNNAYLFRHFNSSKTVLNAPGSRISRHTRTVANETDSGIEKSNVEKQSVSGFQSTELISELHNNPAEMMTSVQTGSAELISAVFPTENQAKNAIFSVFGDLRREYLSESSEILHDIASAFQSNPAQSVNKTPPQSVLEPISGELVFAVETEHSEEPQSATINRTNAEEKDITVNSAPGQISVSKAEIRHLTSLSRLLLNSYTEYFLSREEQNLLNLNNKFQGSAVNTILTKLGEPAEAFSGSTLFQQNLELNTASVYQETERLHGSAANVKQTSSISEQASVKSLGELNLLNNYSGFTLIQNREELSGKEINKYIDISSVPILVQKFGSYSMRSTNNTFAAEAHKSSIEILSTELVFEQTSAATPTLSDTRDKSELTAEKSAQAFRTAVESAVLSQNKEIRSDRIINSSMALSEQRKILYGNAADGDLHSIMVQSGDKFERRVTNEFTRIVDMVKQSLNKFMHNTDQTVVDFADETRMQINTTENPVTLNRYRNFTENTAGESQNTAPISPIKPALNISTIVQHGNETPSSIHSYTENEYSEGELTFYSVHNGEAASACRAEEMYRYALVSENPKGAKPTSKQEKANAYKQNSSESISSIISEKSEPQTHSSYLAELFNRYILDRFTNWKNPAAHSGSPEAGSDTSVEENNLYYAVKSALSSRMSAELIHLVPDIHNLSSAKKADEILNIFNSTSSSTLQRLYGAEPRFIQRNDDSTQKILSSPEAVIHARNHSDFVFNRYNSAAVSNKFSVFNAELPLTIRESAHFSAGYSTFERLIYSAGAGFEKMKTITAELHRKYMPKADLTSMLTENQTAVTDVLLLDEHTDTHENPRELTTQSRFAEYVQHRLSLVNSSFSSAELIHRYEIKRTENEGARPGKSTDSGNTANSRGNPHFARPLSLLYHYSELHGSKPEKALEYLIRRQSSGISSLRQPEISHREQMTDLSKPAAADLAEPSVINNSAYREVLREILTRSKSATESVVKFRDTLLGRYSIGQNRLAHRAETDTLQIPQTEQSIVQSGGTGFSDYTGIMELAHYVSDSSVNSSFFPAPSVGSVKTSPASRQSVRKPDIPYTAAVKPHYNAQSGNAENSTVYELTHNLNESSASEITKQLNTGSFLYLAGQSVTKESIEQYFSALPSHSENSAAFIHSRNAETLTYTEATAARNSPEKDSTRSFSGSSYSNELILAESSQNASSTEKALNTAQTEKTEPQEAPLPTTEELYSRLNINSSISKLLSSEKELNSYVRNQINNYFSEQKSKNGDKVTRNIFSNTEIICEQVISRLEQRLKTERRLNGR